MMSYLNNQAGLTVRNLLRGLTLAGLVLALGFYLAAPPAPPPPAATAEPRPDQRQALELLAGELRTLNLAEPPADPAAALVGAGPTLLSFRAPAAPAVQAEPLVPVVTYIFSAGNLVRNDGSFARVLCGGLDLLEFSYRLNDGRRLSRPGPEELSRIRAIELTLIAKLDTPAAPGQPARRNFRLPSGATYTPPDDGRPRQQLSTSVQLRHAEP